MAEDGRVVPHNLEAEEALLGAMLLTPQAVFAGVAGVTEQDFFQPKHGMIFGAIRTLYGNGVPIDPTTVGDELRRRGEAEKIGGTSALVQLQLATPSTSSASRYAGIIADHATMRRLVAVGGRITELGYSWPSDVGAALDEAKAALGEITVAQTTTEGLVESLDDLCAEAEEDRDWVIPDLLARTDRMIVVAHPGSGKTMLFRQVAVMCSQGLHPFTYGPIPKVRALLVDFENPRGIIRRCCQPILGQARRSARDYECDRTALYHRPGGIDIRKRADFAELDAACSEVAPDIVCLGPLYKLYRSGKGESYEDVATDVIGRLDDLRTRHGFALLIEHHAGKDRQMVPQGSSVWERWPEFGVALTPTRKNDRTKLDWGEWRGAREDREWPTRLDRGSVWPWEASFDTQPERF